MLITFMAAAALAQPEATKAAQRAGIELPNATAKATKCRGREAPFHHTPLKAVRTKLFQEVGISEIARATGLNRQMIYCIQNRSSGLTESLGGPGVRPAALSSL